jgi:uncharacterized OsmC-like protein
MAHIDVVPFAETPGTAGDAYVIDTGRHRLVVDQPVDAGGTDTGPTPTDLFVASLVSCVAHYAGRYLTRHLVERDGLRVSADWDFAADRPARVGRIAIEITPPPGLPEERIPALMAVASHCTVHNSLESTPEVTISLATAAV